MLNDGIEVKPLQTNQSQRLWQPRDLWSITSRLVDASLLVSSSHLLNFIPPQTPKPSRLDRFADSLTCSMIQRLKFIPVDEKSVFVVFSQIYISSFTEFNRTIRIHVADSSVTPSCSSCSSFRCQKGHIVRPLKPPCQSEAACFEGPAAMNL